VTRAGIERQKKGKNRYIASSPQTIHGKKENRKTYKKGEVKTTEGILLRTGAHHGSDRNQLRGKKNNKKNTSIRYIRGERIHTEENKPSFSVSEQYPTTATEKTGGLLQEFFNPVVRYCRGKLSQK